MWKFEFEAPLNHRILRSGFWGITTDGSNCWYYNGKWQTITLGSTHATCHSFRAFKSHLRRHPELKGQVVLLVSRYRGHDIRARWEDDNPSHI